ncbi:MAG: tRNA (adenine(22)-N(1))-methyltransferase [Lachnospiraceae bacterium]
MEKRAGRYGSVRGLLSERMLRTAALVTRGNRTADVGCDHAYTSIYLIQQGISPHVVAMDINAGPLARAKENVVKFGMEEQIELRQSDGLAALAPSEADTLLIAGMGGPLMEQILTAFPETLASVTELVLQPQSEIAEVRRFLHRVGFRITAEDMLSEDGKYYVMFRAEHGAECAWTEEEYLYGKLLLENGTPVLKRFLEEERCKTEELLRELTAAGTEKARKRREELLWRLKQNLCAAQRL